MDTVMEEEVGHWSNVYVDNRIEGYSKCLHIGQVVEFKSSKILSKYVVDCERCLVIKDTDCPCNLFGGE